MASLFDPFREDMARIKRELEKLQGLKIHVGIMGDAGSDLLTIAGVHEYGATIRAKKAKTFRSRLQMKLRRPAVHATSRIYNSSRFLLDMGILPEKSPRQRVRSMTRATMTGFICL